MTPEQWTQGIGIGFAVVVAMAASFWWGWDSRERLSLKLEFFDVSDRNWRRHDELLKKSPRRKSLPHVGRRPRAKLHEINERRHERQSDK